MHKPTSKIRQFATAAVACLALSMGAGNCHAQVVDLGNYTSPSTLTYQNSLPANQGQFTDWYGFSVNPSILNGITASISLGSLFGISQLSTELYKGSIINGQANPLNWLASGVNSNVQFGQAVQSTSVISPITLTGNESYLIKVSGLVSGNFGGNYAGVTNLAPVPIPATLPLLLGGLAIMGMYRRKTK
jgi:hypothetical protein